VGVKQGVREMNVRDKVSIHRQGRRDGRGDGSSFFNKSKSKKDIETMFYFNEGIILKAVTLILTQASSLQFWLYRLNQC